MHEDFTLFFCSMANMPDCEKDIKNTKVGCTAAGEITIETGLVTTDLSKITFPAKYFNIETVRVDDVRVTVLKGKEIQEKAKKVKTGKNIYTE